MGFYKTDVKKVEGYRTLDGRVFDTYEEALGYECEREFYNWYKDFALFGNDGNSYISSNALLIWLRTHREFLTELLEKLKDIEGF